MAYSKEEWQKAKVLRESGKSLGDVSLHTGIDKSSIQRKEKKEKWIVGKTQQLKADIVDVEKKNATILQRKTQLRNKIATLEDYEVTLLDELIQDEVGIKSLLFSTTALNIIRVNENLKSNTKLEKINIGDGMQRFEEVGLGSSDYKNHQDTLDKASITLEHAPRHANSQVQINNTNAQQNSHTELNQTIVEETLAKFNNEY